MIFLVMDWFFVLIYSYIFDRNGPLFCLIIFDTEIIVNNKYKIINSVIINDFELYILIIDILFKFNMIIISWFSLIWFSIINSSVISNKINIICDIKIFILNFSFDATLVIYKIIIIIPPIIIKNVINENHEDEHNLFIIIVIINVCRINIILIDIGVFIIGVNVEIIIINFIIIILISASILIKI